MSETPTGRLLEHCHDVLNLVGDRAEASVTLSRGTTGLARFAGSAIHQNLGEDTANLALTVVVDGRRASASTTKLERESCRNLVERTIEGARVRPPDETWPGFAPSAPAPAVEHFDESTAGAGPEARAELVKSFVDGGGLEAAGYASTSSTEVAYANSAGQVLSGRSTSATVDGIQRTGSSDGSAGASSVRIDDLDGAACGSLAADRARAGADPVDLEPGVYEVVLDRRCVANMLFFLSRGFNAKSHDEGSSFVRLGEAQFDEAVDIWDDATDPRTLGQVFDAEGTPKHRVDLVRGGTSSELLHDRRTAAKTGASPTGHGTGDADGGSASNWFFGEGFGASADLIASVERGLFVCEFWYTRILDPKTQVVTGLTRNGLFLIENGQLKSGVRDMRFTQSYAAALAPGNVKGVTADACLVYGAHVPTVHLGSWNFTGGSKG